MTKHLLFLVALALLIVNPEINFAQEVFINEIHYDNVSTDADEAIEIAGPSGTDLTGWSIVLYNGSGGAVYNTLVLSGTIPDQQSGYGTVVQNYAVNGIQNGAPDGIALVDAANSVVQFLSYEGSFTAVGGPADGMTSVDIGVLEGGSDVSGLSLQLVGNGTNYANFTWQAPTASSFGSVNAAQVFGTPVLSVIINEFVLNHVSNDADEYIEILSDPNTDLSAYTLLEIEGDGTGAGVIDEVTQLGTTDANGYYLIEYPNDALENGTLSLLLVKNFTGALSTDLDTDNDGVFDTTPWESIVDDVSVNDGGTGDLTYASVVLSQSFDGGTQTVGGASRIPDGIDTDAVSDWVRNDFEGAGLPSYPGVVAADGEAINTPGTENRIAEEIIEAEIVINEIDSDTDGTDILEFVELYDGGIGNVQLDGYVLVFYNGSNDLSYAAYDLDGYTTNANGYFVLGNEGVSNVSLIFSGNGLQNGPDAVALYKGDATDFPNGTGISLINLVDAIVYDTNDADDAELLTLLNPGEPQVDENGSGNQTVHSIQRYPNGEGGFRNTNTYLAAIPTPGKVNSNATEAINLVINEVDSDTEGTDALEFIELFDGGAGNTSLAGYVLVFFNGNGDVSYAAYDLAGYTTNAEGYFVLGNADVPNVDLIFNGNSLQNGADAVALYQGTAADFPNGTLVTTAGLIDALVYDTNDADDEGLLILLNAGEPQVNEDEEGNAPGHSMQRIPNGEGGVLNTSSYAMLTPTPGTANGGSIIPDEPITILEARNVADGTIVTITGTLTVSDQFAGSAYIQDATGAIAVFDTKVHGAGIFTIGDSITITGTRSTFNGQIQISPVSLVVSNGVANQPIVPVDIPLIELGSHPAELVRIINPVFPKPGDLLFGNSNYIISEASGSGEIRIDADAPGLAGLAQPETCGELIGVVGRYYEIFQLMPRNQADMLCAEKYEPDGSDLTIPKDQTLDIVAWNIEWFGDEGNAPAPDAVQKDSVKAVLLALDADIYGVEEISDDALFAQLVSEMPGYAYVLSDATSYPNDPGTKQKLGFIYKTATVSPVSTKVLLATIHPYYNGGNASFLTDYPDPNATRFYASGRLPFMMTADVTISGATQRISFISLHARANSSDAQAVYDMRKYDVEVLKDTLDAQYANENIIMLGDYNDDVDFTVADVSTTVSTFQAYVDDNDNYDIVTSVLSDLGYRSYAFYENMIDHIMLSNELSDKYIDNSARVHYEFYDGDYTSTTSDHFPVSARLLFEPLQIVSTVKTDISCSGNNDGTATVSVSGGIPPYSYEWSDGQTTQNAINLATGSYTIYVTDASGNSVSSVITISESAPMVLTMVEDQKVYFGYPDSACAILSATGISGGTPEYTYSWSTGETSENIRVCPSETSTYTLTVSDVNNCSVTGDVTVNVEDIHCGFGRIPRIKVCFRHYTFCIPAILYPYIENLGVDLGACQNCKHKKSAALNAESIDEMEEAFEINAKVYPNPFVDQLSVVVESKISTDIEVLVYSATGEMVHSESQSISEGKSQFDLELYDLKPGVYILKTIGLNENDSNVRIVKQ